MAVVTLCCNPFLAIKIDCIIFTADTTTIVKSHSCLKQGGVKKGGKKNVKNKKELVSVYAMTTNAFHQVHNDQIINVLLL